MAKKKTVVGGRGSERVIKFSLAGAAMMVCSMLPAGQAWDPGEPVVTYYGGPGCFWKKERINDFWAKQLKEGGFNTVWAKTPEELDVAAKYGLRAIYKIYVSDPLRKAPMEERVNRVKNHPALYLYELTDEPSAGKFVSLGRVKEFVHTLDPKHPVWVNLLPTYANYKQLGVGGKDGWYGMPAERISAYWEHVRLFCELFQPELLTYDHYHFKNNGDGNHYFLNLGIIQQNAAARRIPFWNGLQSCTWRVGERASPTSPRIPGEHEMRFLVHTTAAYGAHGLYWYVYTCNKEHFGAVVEEDGTTGEKYEYLKKIHREFIAFSSVLSRLQFRGAYSHGMHPAGTTPWSEQAILTISPDVPSREIANLQRIEDTVLVTRFSSRDGQTYLMAVNCDYAKDRTVQATAPAPAELFDPVLRRWSPVGRKFDLSLVRGGGAILRLAAK